MLHLWLDEKINKTAKCVLISQSPIVSKLETTWQLGERYCFGILFIDFCAMKVKQMTNSLTSVEWYLWNTCIHQQKEVFNDKSVKVRQTLSIPKSWIWLDSLCRMENLYFERPNSFAFWIENCCCPNRWNFFEQMAEYFYEMIKPAVWMAFLLILNAGQTVSEWVLVIWTDTHWCMFSYERS